MNLKYEGSDPMRKQLGGIIRQRMKALNLTYERTAELAGISRCYLAKIIQGVRNPREAVLLSLTDVLMMDKKKFLQTAYSDRLPKERWAGDLLAPTCNCKCPVWFCKFLTSVSKTRRFMSHITRRRIRRLFFWHRLRRQHENALMQMTEGKA